MLQQKVYGHNLGTQLALHWIQPHIVPPGLVPDPEHLRDGGAGNIRIKHCGFVLVALQGNRQQRSNQGLAHAPLAADHPDDLADLAQLMGLFQHAFRLSFAAALAAAAAVMCASFAHCMLLSAGYSSGISQL